MEEGRRSRVAARGLTRRRALLLAVAAASGVARPGRATLAEEGAKDERRTRVEGAGSADAGGGRYLVEGRAVDYPDPPPPIGDQIVGFAMGYLGYPYVAAGSGPGGFDCSGFARWVMLNVLGVEIGTGIDGQPAAGAWVEWGAWQPGDLVFFQNTYRAGLSHVGIYIGDGLFIHAENEGTGVVVSSVSSDYYGPRYWGAVRVA